MAWTLKSNGAVPPDTTPTGGPSPSSVEFVDGGSVAFSPTISQGQVKVHGKASMWVDVRDYGAKGDGVADDTAAIQAAVSAAVSLNGGMIYIPKGTYLISSAINVPFATGWKIAGSSLLGTSITQTADNTPIFEVSQNNTWGWTICDLELTYANPQPSANTNACAIHFTGPVPGPSSEIYNFRLSHLFFKNCSYGIGGDTTTQHSSWGMWADHLFFDPSVTGGVVNFASGFTEARPNCHFSNIYVRADSMVGPIFNVNDCELFTMDAIEINNALLGPTLVFENGGGSIVCGAFKLEVGTYTSGSNHMFNLANGHYSFDTVRLDTVTASNGWTGEMFKDSSGTNTHIHIEVLAGLNNWTQSSGTTYVFHGGGTNTSYVIGALPRGLPSGVQLTDNGGTVTAESAYVREWNNGKVGADRGDSDYTVVVGDPNVITYETVLTATRTVTLPQETFPGNMFNGLRYLVRISTGATTNFGLNIDNAAGHLAQIPKGYYGFIEFTYRRLKWVQTGYNLILAGGDGVYLQNWLGENSSTGVALASNAITVTTGNTHITSTDGTTLKTINGRPGGLITNNGWFLFIVNSTGSDIPYATGGSAGQALTKSGVLKNSESLFLVYDGSFAQWVPVSLSSLMGRQSGVGSSTGYSAGGTAATFHSDDTYTGNVGSTAYTLNGIVAALKNVGLLAP